MRPLLGLLLVPLATAVPAETPAPAAGQPAPVLIEVKDDEHRPGGLVLEVSGTEAHGAVALPAAPLVAPAPPALPVDPDLAPPAPVPAQRAPDQPQRIVLPPTAAAPQAYTTLITRPMEIDEESASDELLAWHDHVIAKQDRRIERGAEIGGLAAIGVRLGGRSQLGQVEGLTDQQIASLTRWNDEGALVLSVVPGSPAEAAGLLPGDVVVQFGGIWIDSMNLMVRIASRAIVGVEKDVWVLRDGEIERLWLTPVDRRDLGRR